MLSRSKATKQSLDIPGTSQHTSFKIWRTESHMTDSEAAHRYSHRPPPPTTRISGSTSDAPPRTSKIFKATKSVEGGHGSIDTKAKRMSIRQTASEAGHGTRYPIYQTTQVIPPVPPIPSVYGNMTAGGIVLVDDRSPTTSASSSRNSSSENLPSADVHGRLRTPTQHITTTTMGYQSLRSPSTGHVSDSAVKASLRARGSSMSSRVPPPYDGQISPSPSQRQQQPRPVARGPSDRKPVNQVVTASPSNPKPAGTVKQPPRKKVPKPSPPSIGRQSDGEWSMISPPTSVCMIPPDSQPPPSRAPDSFVPVKEPQKERSNRSTGHGWFNSLSKRHAPEEDVRKQYGHRPHASLDGGSVTHKLHSSKPPVSGRNKLFSTQNPRKSEDTLLMAGNASGGEESLHSHVSRAPGRKVSAEDSASKKASPVVSGLRSFFSRTKPDDASNKYGTSPHVSNDSLRVDTSKARPSHSRSESSPWSFGQFRYKSPAGAGSSVETLSKSSINKFSFKSSKRKPVPDSASLNSTSKEPFTLSVTWKKDSKPLAGRASPHVEPPSPQMPLPSMVAAASASNTARRRPPPIHPPRSVRDSPPNSQPKTSATSSEIQDDEIILEPRQRPFSNRPPPNPNTNLEDSTPVPISTASMPTSATPSVVSHPKFDPQSPLDTRPNFIKRKTPSPPNSPPNLDATTTTSPSDATTSNATTNQMSTKPTHTTIPSPATRPAPAARPPLLRSSSYNSIPGDTEDVEGDSLEDDKDPLSTPSSLGSPPQPPVSMPPVEHRRQASGSGYNVRNQAQTNGNSQDIWLPHRLQLGSSVDGRENQPGQPDIATGPPPQARPLHRMSTSRPFTKRVPINSWVESTPQMTTVALQATGEPTIPTAKAQFPFRLTSAAQNRSISAASMEAVVGLALSSHPPTPGSIHMDMPGPPSPPTRHPALGVEEWRKNGEDEIHYNGRTRRRRPGVTFDFPDSDKFQYSSRHHLAQVESIIAE